MKECIVNTHVLSYTNVQIICVVFKCQIFALERGFRQIPGLEELRVGERGQRRRQRRSVQALRLAQVSIFIL